jgi:hypothetical protein
MTNILMDLVGNESRQDIKDAAALKVWSKIFLITKATNNPSIYWKMDIDRQIELNKLDMFEEEVWSYILGLIEKDNKL